MWHFFLFNFSYIKGRVSPFFGPLGPSSSGSFMPSGRSSPGGRPAAMMGAFGISVPGAGATPCGGSAVWLAWPAVAEVGAGGGWFPDYGPSGHGWFGRWYDGFPTNSANCGGFALPPTLAKD